VITRGVSYYWDGERVNREAAIAVVMPAIPIRTSPEGNGMVERAIDSIHRQTLRPIEIHVAVDLRREGAVINRQRALDMVSPRAKLVAFLDDDDEWYPHHLATQYGLIQSGADVAYSWFDGNDPFPMHRGRQWDSADPHHLTMTLMVRAELAKQVGFVNHHYGNPEWPGEDWAFIQGLNNRGARFAGTGEITGTYHAHGGNTSGLASRW
jgi:glycosyltransferase involved in cell wall biosynthesis